MIRTTPTACRPVARALVTARGVLRSLQMYYGDPRHVLRMRRGYAPFIRPGDLCFDVGAHIGSREAAWLSLGAQVVAVEPLPVFAALLRGLYGWTGRVAVEQVALGAQPGRAEMLVSTREPTVSTLAHEWAAHMPAQRRSFAQTRWESTLSVPVRTLDELIARYGEPRFCKVDVEGFEPDVLRGLSRPLQALSFEYVAPNYARAAACVERLDALGAYVYAWSSGESMRLHPCGWLEARELLELLRTFTADEQPGDVYARRR